MKDVFDDFVGEHQEALQLVAVYGSATRKTDVEGSDVDVLALVDTTKDMSQRRFDRIKNDLKELEEQNSGYELHIQPPKPLKKWWELLLESEPWVITSIEDLQAIYDPENLCDTLNTFPATEYMEGDLKAKEMLQKGLDNLEDVREEVVKDTIVELQENVVEAAQSVFRFQGKKVPEDKLENKMKENLVEDRELMTEQDIENFAEVQSYNPENIDFRKLENIFESGLQFIDQASDTIRQIEMQRREWIIEESFAEISKVCKSVLDNESNGKKLLEDFRQEYVEKGELSKEYEELLDDIIEFKDEKENGNLEELKGEKLYSTSAKVSDFKTAVENISTYNRGETNEISENREEIERSSSQYSALQEFQEKVSEQFGDIIKASWILSIEEILATEDFTVKVLVDTDQSETDNIEEFVEEAATSIKEETGYRIHPDTVTLSDYWRKLKTGDERLYSELRYATTLYDPEKIFLPVKQMVEEGRLEGTREAIQNEISSSIENVLLLRDRTKVQALNKIYKSTVALGQAMLIDEDLPVPVQKKVPEKLREELVQGSDLDEEIYEMAKHNIRYWKDYEHGKFDEITVEDLNKLRENSRTIAEGAKTRLSNGD